jgi:hypothetical protein
VPTLTLGSNTGVAERRWRRVQSAARLSDGSIAAVVTDSLRHEIRLFNPTGKFVRRIGSAARIADESFIPGTVVGLAGDTLLNWDLAHQRLTWFTAGGKPVRTLGVKQKPDMIGPTNVQVGSFLNVFGTLPDGGVLAVDRPYSTFRPTGNYHDSISSCALHPTANLCRLRLWRAASLLPMYPPGTEVDGASGRLPRPAV